VSKKIKKLKKPVKLRKLEKNNQKNQTVKKPIKILKKPDGSVRFSFGFINKKPEPKKQVNQEKTEKTELNRFLS